MFQESSSQTSLNEIRFCLSEKMSSRLQRTWALTFRQKVLPLIDERLFADFYCPDNGRPNTSVRQLIGMLLLKDWWDLTDQQALDGLAFDVRWQTALGVEMDEAWCCQKTLHNFRAHVLSHARGQLLFTSLTDQLLRVLGIQTSQQRMDSTHILSRMALLTRLQLLSETIRVVLRALEDEEPGLRALVSVAVRRRYLTETGKDTDYDDAPSREARRRLGVAARDAWRVWDALRGAAVSAATAEQLALLDRLVQEQCVVTATPTIPQADDADVSEPPVAVVLKAAKQVAADTMQTPHDPDATYGHKGKGYEVQITETCGNDDLPELITRIAVSQSSGSDQAQTVPAVEELAERGLQPEALTVDTGYGATDNVLACAALGTTVVSPVAGREMPVPPDDIAGVGSFHVQLLPDDPPSCCPQGVEAVIDTRQPNPTTGPTGVTHVTLKFSAIRCATCQWQSQCLAFQKDPALPTYTTTEEEALLTRRRRLAATADYKKRYAIRAGCEATNSELKRSHGLGRLRVRGAPRVELAVCLKGLACNVKRAVTYWTRQTNMAVAALTNVENASAMA